MSTEPQSVWWPFLKPTTVSGILTGVGAAVSWGIGEGPLRTHTTLDAVLVLATLSVVQLVLVVMLLGDEVIRREKARVSKL